MQAMLSLDHFPAGMELFPASDEDQWSLIKGVIDDSDYYVLVIGGRYGSLDETGISYTEKEFDYAVKSGKPVLAFVHENPDVIPAGKTDKSDALRQKLDKFIEKIKTSGRHIKFWSNADDLKAKVISAVAAETKRNPREGWIRAGFAADPAVMENLRQQLDEARAQLLLAQNAPPPGTEKYQSGSDEFEVNLKYDDSKGQEQWRSVMVTWDQIFFEVGPLVMEEASEGQMRVRLGRELWRYDYEKFTNVAGEITMDNDNFDTIKIQLLALGLIRKSPKKHVPSDTGRYWSLTPFGETELMKLRAITKK